MSRYGGAGDACHPGTPKFTGIYSQSVRTLTGGIGDSAAVTRMRTRAKSRSGRLPSMGASQPFEGRQ